eukprot:10626054-Prorocentrum_lima.AAC.1
MTSSLVGSEMCIRDRWCTKFATDQGCPLGRKCRYERPRDCPGTCFLCGCPGTTSPTKPNRPKRSPKGVKGASGARGRGKGK